MFMAYILIAMAALCVPILIYGAVSDLRRRRRGIQRGTIPRSEDPRYDDWGKGLWGGIG